MARVDDVAPEPPIATAAGADRAGHRHEASSSSATPAATGRTVMLLHGWLVSADLNWCGAYGALAEAGYRVLAIDHRGHGRGLRPLVPFRLLDCAADAAGVLRTLDPAPAIVVGYSMGGAIAQLIARDHAMSSAGWSSAAPRSTSRIAESAEAWQAMGTVRAGARGRAAAVSGGPASRGSESRPASTPRTRGCAPS